jgi:hypothetical protein
LEDLGVGLAPGDPLTILNDNMGAILLAKHPHNHTSTKHFDIRTGYLREKRDHKIISLDHIPSKDNEVDILTKGLPTEQFTILREKLAVSKQSEVGASGSVGTTVTWLRKRPNPFSHLNSSEPPILSFSSLHHRVHCTEIEKDSSIPISYYNSLIQGEEKGKTVHRRVDAPAIYTKGISLGKMSKREKKRKRALKNRSEEIRGPASKRGWPISFETFSVSLGAVIPRKQVGEPIGGDVGERERWWIIV